MRMALGRYVRRYVGHGPDADGRVQLRHILGRNAGRIDKTHGEAPTPLKLTHLGTAGAGETRVISAIAQRCSDIFGSRQSVVVAAHTGVAAPNVGCGGRTLAGLFRTMGETIDELKENNCATLRAN